MKNDNYVPDIDVPDIEFELQSCPVAFGIGSQEAIMGAQLSSNCA